MLTSFRNRLDKAILIKELFEDTLYKRIILIAIILLLVAANSYHLFNSSLALGIDGYYYFVQCETLYTYGNLYFPTSTPLILYFLYGLKFLFTNTILAIKIGAIILNLFLYIGIFLLVKKITKNICLGVLAICILELSKLHLYLIVEYINYLGAIAFIVWSVYLFILSIENKKRYLIILSALCFITALGSHRSTIPIVLTIAGLFLFYKLLQNLGERFDKKHIILILTVVLFTLFIPVILKAQPFINLPLILTNEFTIIPQFPRSVSIMPELIILLILSPLVLFTVIFNQEKIKSKSGKIILGVISLWSILITLNPFIAFYSSFDSIGGRLRVLACIQVAILVPGIVWLLKDLYPRIQWYIWGLIVPLMIWSFFNPLPRGAQNEYLARRERLITGLKSNSQNIEENSFIIAVHGEQFVVTAILGLPSQLKFPQENKYSSIYWLLNLVPPTFIDSSMTIIAKDPVGSYTVLVRNDKAFNQRLQNNDVRQALSRGNRHLDMFLTEVTKK
jgi:hypothetical protein